MTAPDPLAAAAEAFLDEVLATPAFVYPPCAHCGLEVEDRGHPVAREGVGFVWSPNWVHADWGGRICFPQQRNSPRAEPTPVKEAS